MSNIDKRALREAAEKATPGPWYVHDKPCEDGNYGIDTSDKEFLAEAVVWWGFSRQSIWREEDAKHIAAANPATVLALLDELEAAKKDSARWFKAFEKAVSIGARYEERIAELSSAVIAPGIMRCAGCGFVLTKNSINMAAGTITAGDSKTEPCPNGCGPLWPVTWKEQAIEMRDSSEQWFEELQEARQRIAELESEVNDRHNVLSLESAHLNVRQRRLETAECMVLKMASLLNDIKNSRPGGVYFNKWDAQISNVLRAAGTANGE